MNVSMDVPLDAPLGTAKSTVTLAVSDPDVSVTDDRMTVQVEFGGPPDLVGFGAVPFETEPHRVTEYAKTARPYSISCRADLLVRLPKIPVPSPGQPPIRHKMQLANLWQGSCFIPFHTIFI